MLNKFLDICDETHKEKSKRLEGIKQSFVKDGVPENIAQYKAEEVVFTPEILEKIKLSANRKAGLLAGITFFFKTEEEIKLVHKHFNLSARQAAVKDSELLIELLKLLEVGNG